MLSNKSVWTAFYCCLIKLGFLFKREGSCLILHPIHLKLETTHWVNGRNKRRVSECKAPGYCHAAFSQLHLKWGSCSCREMLQELLAFQTWCRRAGGDRDECSERGSWQKSSWRASCITNYGITFGVRNYRMQIFAFKIISAERQEGLSTATPFNW